MTRMLYFIIFMFLCFILFLSGPYKVNGVPLRRVPQSYVIATQTKVDISKVKLSDKVNDDMFKRTKKPKKSSGAMFEESAEVCNRCLNFNHFTIF